MAGLACHVGVALWRGFRGAGWRQSRACTLCWDGVGAVSQQVLCTVTGWWQRTCMWRRGEVEGGMWRGGGGGWGGRVYVVERRGVEDLASGEKRVSVTLVKKGTKKK